MAFRDRRDRRRGSSIGPWLLMTAAILAAGALILLVARGKSGKPSAVALPPPAAAPATAPATVPASAPVPSKPVDYMDVVHLNYPEFPTTQPLPAPVALNEAARLVINDPLYLDPMGELWITRADAESTLNVLKAADERSTHVLKEHVVYVHRWPDESGTWQPQLFCRKDDGSYEIVTRLSRTGLEGRHNFDWGRAFSWNNVVVIPTDRGVMLVRPDRRPMELYHEFIPADQFVPGKYSQPQALIDWRGLIAWMPWENDKLGSKGAARFVKDEKAEEHWVTLDSSAGWPERIMHLVPLLDGSILQLVVKEDKSVQVQLMTLDPADVDEKKVAEFVDQLSDPDVAKRTAAFNELTRWGPGIWPILEKLRADQPPEAQVRLEQLLASRITPNIGGMLLQPGPVSVLARSSFGAAMIHSEAGVRLQVEGGDDPPLVAPAWISLVPGQNIQLAPPGLVEELKVKGREMNIVRGEWFVTDENDGPRWWISNHLSGPLLKGKDVEFRQLIGQDGRGRWLFRRNLTDESPTLVIDPTLPDPTPRLPVWNYAVEGGRVGWTSEDWPAIKAGGAWALMETEWKPLDGKTEKFLNSDTPPEANPAPPGAAATEPSTTAPTTQQQVSTAPAVTTAPSSAPSTAPSLDVPILTEKDGTRFYDGQQSLRMVRPDGTAVVWPLPPEAVGTGEVHLFRAAENRLFLFNTPGRILRIRQNTKGADPFKLEATFTKRVPNPDHPERVWLDRAGRIVIAYDNTKLAICFPTGRIPPEIAKKMTAKDLQDSED